MRGKTEDLFQSPSFSALIVDGWMVVAWAESLT